MFTIHPSRDKILKSEFEQEYFSQIMSFLQQEKNEGNLVYPPSDQVFKAFKLTPFDEIKVVILGQDPYHGVGQAMGLSFSVPDGTKLPPSLQNIYKELVQEYPGYHIKQSGDLTRWAKQGVLLLNSILTVRANEPASHRKIGRETFTDAVLSKISQNKTGIVFLLRGSYAMTKQKYIDSSIHNILTSVHPSPLSAYRGWFGSDCFKKCNEYLEAQGKNSIDW